MSSTSRRGLEHPDVLREQLADRYVGIVQGTVAAAIPGAAGLTPR